MKKVIERQKLIKLADRSEFRWGVVAEYTADELADNSDDEKRIEKTEKADKCKRSLTGRTTPAKRPAATPSIPTISTQASWIGSGSCQKLPDGPMLQLWRDGPPAQFLSKRRRTSEHQEVVSFVYM